MRKMIIAFAATAAVFGCTREESPVGGGKTIEREFIAGFEEQTRTSVDAAGKVDWSAGDVISYYTTSGGTVGSVTVPADCHSTSFTATVGSGDTFIIAAYGGTVGNPQGNGLTLSDAVKAEQSGKFEDAHVSVSKRCFENGNTLNFKNITSLIRFSLTRDDVSYVMFSANDGTKLHGDGILYVTFDGESISSVKFGESEGGSSIRVNTGGSGTFYISSIPCEMAGFTVRCYDDSDRVLGAVESSKTLSLAASGIVNLGVLDVPNKCYLAHKEESKCFPYRYRRSGIDIKEVPDDSLYYVAYGISTPQLRYGGTLNLRDWVIACVGDSIVGADKTTLASALVVPDDSITYKFYFADNNGEFGAQKQYIGKDGVTDQNKFVSLTQDGKMEVVWPSLHSPASIGRTPLIYVQAWYKGKFVTSSYIKVEITNDFKYHAVMAQHRVEFRYEDLIPDGRSWDPNWTSDKLDATLEEINEKVLCRLGISFQQFNDRYYIHKSDVSVLDSVSTDPNRRFTYTNWGSYTFPNGVAPLIDDNWWTSSTFLSLLLNDNYDGPFNHDKTITLVYEAKNNRVDTNVAINFTYRVSEPEPHNHPFVLSQLRLHKDYLLNPSEDWLDTVNVNPPYDVNNVAAVKVKGREGKPFNDAIIEHFDKYKILPLVHNDGATLTFKIENYDTTDFKQEYKNNAGTMMDRNLGATCAAPSDVHTLGLLYQWGRKDPFLGGCRISYSSFENQEKAK